MAKDYNQPASDESLNKAKLALEANGFTVEVVDSLEAAHDRVLKLIPEGSEVFTGTSATLKAAGLDKEINEGSRYVSARNKFMPLTQNPETALEARRLGSASDYALGSAHEITEDGHVYVASMSGSQMPNYIYGANHVIWVVGTQKIVKDANEAMDRLENHTLKLEDERMMEAYNIHSQISKLLIYRTDPQHRVTIIFVKQSVGF